MLNAKVVQNSQAAYYSHVHLTPKPNGKWRFAIDYRMLNAVCEGMGWPLSNIQHMIQRIGQKRPKFFAKLDLTHGYHQAPLHIDSRAYTAFITFMGLYEWLRVPMGLKGAPAYFQGVLAAIVLLNLLYVCCELYIDDIIIYGTTEQEFLANLEKVLQRLQKYKLIVNPDKVDIGMSEVEFVGHTVNEHGMSFSREKIEKVLQIPEPKYGKELKSFIGVVGWFHDHIRDYAMIMRPLQKMVVNYERNRKLIWTEEARVSFHKIKQIINDIPPLFFPVEGGTIFLCTDASDYGIGSYCYQTVGDKVYHIAFVSKLLSSQEARWSMIEKEAYAIVYSLKKLEYLLRDKPFILKTDHKNLTFIDRELNAKVKR